MKSLMHALGLSLVAALLVLAGESAALAKFAYVDMAKVVAEYDKTQDAQALLEKEFASVKAGLADEKNALDNRRQVLDAKKGVLSEGEYAKLGVKLNGEMDAFQAKYQDAQDNLKKRQKEEMDKLVVNIRKAVAKVAANEKYDLVLEKDVLFYGGENITYRVLDVLSQQ